MVRGVVEADDLAGAVVDEDLPEVGPRREGADGHLRLALPPDLVTRELLGQRIPELLLDLVLAERFRHDRLFEPEIADGLHLAGHLGDVRGE